MLGAGVAKALAARGDSVTVLQRRPSGLGLPEVLADVADSAVVQRALTGQDAVIHLAAKVNVVGPEREFQRVNVEGTRAVIDGCRQTGVQRLVYVSTPSVAHSGHALVGVGPAPAEPAAARGPYARTKAVAEHMALAADTNGLAVVALRPHLVFGPVDAFVAALDRCEQVHGQALVVTNGEPRPIAELLGAICDATGVPQPTRRVSPGLAKSAGSAAQLAWAIHDHFWPDHRVEDPPITRFVVEQMSTAHWFDQRQTRRLLHWEPRISLDAGLEELRRHYLRLGST